MVAFQALISLLIAGAGVYVILRSKSLARGLQELYVRSAKKQQEKKAWNSYLFVNNPETWQTPFARLLFRAMIVFFGIMLIIIAYPIVFGPIIL